MLDADNTAQQILTEYHFKTWEEYIKETDWSAIL
jgi:hypothetical protein